MAFAGLTHNSVQTDTCYSRVHVTAEMKPNIILKQNECPFLQDTPLKYAIQKFSYTSGSRVFVWKTLIIHKHKCMNAVAFCGDGTYIYISIFLYSWPRHFCTDMSNLAAISVFPQSAHFRCVYCPKWNWLFKTSHNQQWIQCMCHLEIGSVIANGWQWRHSLCGKQNGDQPTFQMCV